MASREPARAYAVAVAVIIGIALLVAACGSSSSTSGAAASGSSSNSSGYGSAPASSSSSSSPAGAIKIATAKGSAGTYLVGPTGRALYMWVADKLGTSSCSGSCAQAWPPLTTKGSPQASAGAMAADLSTTKRSDGTMQVTYKGHPLYYFAGDSGSGSTKGQGSNSFGAKWWLLAPSGSPITAGGSSSGTTSSPSRYG